MAFETIILYSEIDLLNSKCIGQTCSLKFKIQYFNLKEWSFNSSKLICKKLTFFYILQKKNSNIIHGILNFVLWMSNFSL